MKEKSARTHDRSRRAAALGAGVLLAMGAAMNAVAVSAPTVPASPAYVPAQTDVHRLSSDQYRNVVADVFGPDIELGGRFDPGLRVDGLLAVGYGSESIAPAGMEQYDAMARKIAAQVVDTRHRAELIRCTPRSESAPDDACAAQALARIGRLLYRRPLTSAELRSYVGAARVATTTLKDFYSGLSLSLAAMLSSPQFLFVQEVAVPEPAHRGSFHLDGYSLASRLSFFLWDTGPDLPLLEAAERGELNTRAGLARQVARMIGSRRLEMGMRAFFTDMFQFDQFSTLTKDVALYPKFNAQVAADAQEETLKTIVDLLVKRDGDYRDLFTTKRTFLTSELAAIYRVPFPNERPNGSPDGWRAFEYPASDPRGGILTQVSFTALHSPPGRGSATIRGKALREVMLCQKVPSPPANVKFDIVLDTNNPVYKTARERLTAHRSNPVCAGCHRIVDPMGLSLENFDGAGEFRTTENGVPIDASGEVNGVKFANAAGLGQAMHDDPAATSCLVNRLDAYALGRQLTGADVSGVKDLESSFAASGYRVTDLMQQIVLSDGFYRVSAPTPTAPARAVRSAQSSQSASNPVQGKPVR